MEEPDSSNSRITPDGHYFLWKGRQLWRCTNPNLSKEDKKALTSELMSARRAVYKAGKAGKGKGAEQKALLAAARARVQKAKEGLGERGPVWWDEEKEGRAVDRMHPKNTQYKEWAENLDAYKEEGTAKKRKGSQADEEFVPAPTRVTRSGSKRQRTGDEPEPSGNEPGPSSRVKAEGDGQQTGNKPGPSARVKAEGDGR
ncbi:hypothetical protein CF319_g6935 [Tilletia indica]|uniref:Uncharacterized protein n=1 Tax=Tilletia indica TaxID=43049 RepID=A0A177TEJ3_9BASI|nr:hypothetical protein CF319_g6935 [Tilletia indica]KAE8245209.1 hypothetical protein A4X13_0g6034 [Tilletia indica]